MTTYFKFEEDPWVEISDDIDLEDFAEKRLLRESGQDNDGGYWLVIEFWRNGISTFGHAEYSSYSACHDTTAKMIYFIYGTFEEVQNSSRRRIVPAKFPPNRDYILI